MESWRDVAHLLALLPGLRCVGIGGDWTDSPESWAAIVPSLSACQDLRFSGEQGVYSRRCTRNTTDVNLYPDSSSRQWEAFQ